MSDFLKQETETYSGEWRATCKGNISRRDAQTKNSLFSSTFIKILQCLGVSYTSHAYVTKKGCNCNQANVFPGNSLLPCETHKKIWSVAAADLCPLVFRL